MNFEWLIVSKLNVIKNGIFIKGTFKKLNIL